MTKSSKPSQMVEKLVNKGVRGISNADGLLSIGWSVDGLSVIERISGTDVPTAGVDKKASGHGVPAYGAAGFSADSFAIDGTDLIPCAQVQTPSNTPSCSVPVAAGKTGYAARVENYERIRQDPTSNTWTVTAKNGTSSLYIALDGGTAVSTFRWHLASVTDTRGNHIDYTWTCDAAFQCDISTIAYKNQGSSTAVSTITFYKETRPDPITYATGKDIRTESLRLKTIAISNSGALLRAYKLTYDTSAATGLSRLTQVQEFGEDATFAVDNTITGGTSLPPYVMTYSNMTGTNGGPVLTTSNWTTGTSLPGQPPLYFAAFTYATGLDFNADSTLT